MRPLGRVFARDDTAAGSDSEQCAGCGAAVAASASECDGPPSTVNSRSAGIENPNDEDLRRRIAANAARRVQECYDWQVILPPFLSLVEGLAPA